MLEFKRTTSASTDFRELIKALDKDLWDRYPNVQGEYTKHNSVEKIDTVIVGYLDGKPVACGCFKEFNEESAEMKRIFVLHEQRGKGIAIALMKELENWAKELNYSNSVLETGTLQVEAIPLYKKIGYSIIPNYPPYEGMEYSVCMKKPLTT